MIACIKLTEFLVKNVPITFNVSGGCGIDLSLGKSPCMGDSGVWFKFCPFCGKEILSFYNGYYWDWWEEKFS
jgi:hypothetical protein